MTKKDEIMFKLFGPPFWALVVPDEVVVLEGYGGFYTHKKPDDKLNPVVVFSEESVADLFIQALEDDTYRARRMMKQDVIDHVLKYQPIVDALVLLDIPERPVYQQIKGSLGV
jgi:hypothetical protein